MNAAQKKASTVLRAGHLFNETYCTVTVTVTVQ